MWEFSSINLTHLLLTVRPVVETEHDRKTDRQGGGPADDDDHVGRSVVMPMLRVKNRRSYGEVSV